MGVIASQNTMHFSEYENKNMVVALLLNFPMHKVHFLNLTVVSKSGTNFPAGSSVALESVFLSNNHLFFYTDIDSL